MQAILVMFRADGERRSFSIARDMTVIGRREDCDLRIPLGEVSRKHCRLVRDGDVLRLEDLGSSNGTYHNGQRVQEVELNAGDSIVIGPVVFVVQIDGVPPDDELAPPAADQEIAAAAVSEPYDPMGPLSPTAQSDVDDGYPSLEVGEGEAVAEGEGLVEADAVAEGAGGEEEGLIEAEGAGEEEGVEAGGLLEVAPEEEGDHSFLFASGSETEEETGVEAPMGTAELVEEHLDLGQFEEGLHGEEGLELAEPEGEPQPEGEHHVPPLNLDELNLDVDARQQPHG